MLYTWNTLLFRKYWVRPIFQNRDFGEHRLIQERESDPEMYHKYLRMDKRTFEKLLSFVQPHILKCNTNMRESIPPKLRLAITIRYLATGASCATLAFYFRVGHSTVCKIVHETSDTLWNVVQPIYLRYPSKDQWRVIADNFNDRWQFPMCVGAIDGKHNRIQAPANTGTQYYSYKHTFSIVLLAMCDANYQCSL